MFEPSHQAESSVEYVMTQSLNRPGSRLVPPKVDRHAIVRGKNNRTTTQRKSSVTGQPRLTELLNSHAVNEEQILQELQAQHDKFELAEAKRMKVVE